MVFAVLLCAALLASGLAVLAWFRPILGVVAIAVIVLFAAWIVWFEPRSLVVTHQEFDVENLAAPVRIVAIGDPQPNMAHWPPSRLQAAFDTAKAQNPDILLWLGDYVYDSNIYRRFGIRDWAFVEPSSVIEAMASIDAPMGSYAILGNHDWWWNGPEVARLLNQTHITLLIDDAVLVEDPRTQAALWIAGLDDISTPRPTNIDGVLAQTDPNAPIIVLSHSPDILPRIPERVALTLSGHTHCGQVYVPFVGRPILPIHNKQYACGAVQEEGKRMVVTSGIGTAILPIRFLTPPEILVVDLVPAGDVG